MDNYFHSEKNPQNREVTENLLKENKGHEGYCEFKQIQNMGRGILFACKFCGKVRFKFFKGE